MATKGRKSKATQQTESSSQDNISIHDSDDEVVTQSVTKRSTTIKNVSGEKPCATSTPARGNRSCSPLTILRNEEKEELAHLNDRFASYIDYVRSLEIAKEKLTKKIQSISHVETTDYDKIRKVYEDELKSLRKMVDELAKERANLEIELKNLRDESANYRKKLERRDLDVTNLQSKLDKLERELSKQRSDSDRYTTLVTQHDIAEKRCAKLNKDLDAEILLRTDIENQNVTLKEQLEFNTRIHNEERLKMRESHVVIEEELTDVKKAEYESRLAEELRAIREETAEEFEAYKVDFEDSFMLRFEELKKNNQQSNDSAMKAREEAVTWRSRVDSLEQSLASKTAEADVLRKRVKDLESLLSYERNEFEEQLKRLHIESDQLRADLQLRLDEFSALMSTKIALDQEIFMYRKLLESEESRCNLSVKACGDTSFSVLSSRAGVKRRRVGEGSEFQPIDLDNDDNVVTSGRDSFKVDLISTSDIEFTAKPDCTGKFVKIYNRGEKDICIGGWTLNYVADKSPETVYKFHHNLHLKSKTDCTIWSSDANATHNSPSDLVMKGSRFFAGTNITITLVNTENEEQARCKIVKDSERSSTTYKRKLASRSVRTGDNSKCTTM